LRRNGLALEQLPLLSETPTASECSQSGGPEFPSSKMFATPQAHDSGKGNPDRVGRFGTTHGGRNLADEILHPAFQSSPAGSLANLIPLQESVRRLLTIVTCGPNLPVSFARFARDGSSQKMYPACCTPSLDGSLVAFSGTWPTWGIARDGACGELPTLERCTAANESSSWPTPRTSDTNGPGLHGDGGMDLRTAVTMWPTPTANEDAAGTPNGKMQAMLGNHPAVRGSGSGSLNPRWVEWLMGFPDGHTVLEPLETASSRSKPIRSSAPSRKSKPDV
jgi:hypothetical protein